MPTQIEEGHLLFEFSDQWQIMKFDDAPGYRNWIGKLQETKAIDFLGILSANKLYFIEVKDFRGDRIQNEQRLLSGDLAIEVAQKVRDSLACIIGAARTPSQAQEWQHYQSFLCNTKTQIFVILWLEYDLPTHSVKRKKVRTSVGSNVLKKELRWLTSHVLVSNMSSQMIPDLTVSNLPHS